MLPDVLGPNLKVVFCGTAAGNESARRKAYYAGPGNKFWRTLYRTKLTPMQLEPGEYKKVLEYGIGLTDLVKRVSGADSELSKQNFDIAGLEAKILNNSPEVLCFNEKKAAQEYMGTKQVEYGLQNIKIGETLIFIAPSTSGAASGYWDESYYFELASIIK
jgi:TDG/mug DNA glycosylase family protein